METPEPTPVMGDRYLRDGHVRHVVKVAPTANGYGWVTWFVVPNGKLRTTGIRDFQTWAKSARKVTNSDTAIGTSRADR